MSVDPVILTPEQEEVIRSLESLAEHPGWKYVVETVEQFSQGLDQQVWHARSYEDLLRLQVRKQTCWEFSSLPQTLIAQTMGSVQTEPDE